MFSISINNTTYENISLKEMENYIRDHEASTYREIWVKYKNSNMCALASGNTAWLMILRFDGDAGLSSRNKNYNGSKDELLKFKLTNGQVDEYPLHWTLPESIWITAVLHFAKTGLSLQSVTWHDDMSDEHAD